MPRRWLPGEFPEGPIKPQKATPKNQRVERAGMAELRQSMRKMQTVINNYDATDKDYGVAIADLRAIFNFIRSGWGLDAGPMSNRTADKMTELADRYGTEQMTRKEKTDWERVRAAARKRADQNGSPF